MSRREYCAAPCRITAREPQPPHPIPYGFLDFASDSPPCPFSGKIPIIQRPSDFGDGNRSHFRRTSHIGACSNFPAPPPFQKRSGPYIMCVTHFNLCPLFGLSGAYPYTGAEQGRRLYHRPRLKLSRPAGTFPNANAICLEYPK